MLQVVDELDDAVGALRHCSVGIGADIGWVLAGAAGAGAIGAGILMGAETLVISAAAIMLSVAPALKIRASHFQPGR